MPKLSKTAPVEAMPKKEDRTEDILKAATDIDVPIANSYWRVQLPVQPSPKTIINFDQMITT